MYIKPELGTGGMPISHSPEIFLSDFLSCLCIMAQIQSFF